MPDETPPAQPAAGLLALDEPAGGVLRLTIENPAKRNALDHPILDALADAVREPTARALLITGAGSIFSAGYDIGDLPGPEDRAGFERAAESLVAHPFTETMEALDACPVPTVAALNGHALGGGLELALSCDLRVASSEARMGMPPAKLGLIYSHTGIAKFIEAIGAPRTRELFMLGDQLDAATAERWGLVGELCAAEEVAERGVALAAELAANAPLAQRGNKRIIGELLAARGRLGPELVAELVALRESCFASEDFFEGVRAFAEKRAPVWRGR